MDRLRQLTKWLAIAFFASLPFHRPPITTVLGPALTLPELLFVPLALCLLAQRIRAERTFTPGLRIVAALGAGFLVPVLLAVEPKRAAVQLVVLVYVALVFEAASTVAALDLRTAAIRALVAGAAVECALALGAFILALFGAGESVTSLVGFYPWMPIPRPFGTTESPPMLAMIAFGALVATLHAGRVELLSRRIALSLGVLFALTILATQSRVVFVALAFTAVYALPKRLGRGAFALAACALVVAVSIRVVPLRSTFPFVDATLSPYRVCHEIAWAIFRDHPLHGIGLEGFRSVWPQYYVPSRHDVAFGAGGEEYAGAALDPHGTIQGYLAEGGIFGIAVIGSLGWTLLRARRRDVREATPYLAALALALLFIDLLTDRSTAAVLGLVVTEPCFPKRANAMIGTR